MPPLFSLKPFPIVLSLSVHVKFISTKFSSAKDFFFCESLLPDMLLLLSSTGKAQTQEPLTLEWWRVSCGMYGATMAKGRSKVDHGTEGGQFPLAR